MSGIFISYRREDSAGQAGRIDDRLKPRFGEGRVFMDIETLEPGADFVECIDEAVGSCGALLAVIGPRWLSVTDAEGRRRIDDPTDFVRLEIAAGLRRGIRGIPVLVDGAQMPAPEGLPDDISGLARLHAVEVSNSRFDYDVSFLLQSVEEVVGPAQQADGEQGPELGTGDVFAGHRILSVAGRGAMGVVYLANQIALDRPVALKLIAAEHSGDESFRKRFKNESKLAASIDHPHVIPIHDAGEKDGQLYVTMRYVDGTDLRAQLRREGPLGPDLAALLVAQVAEALDAAHARGLVHRDVRPSNVMVDWDGDPPHAYLTDFGLSKRLDDGSGRTKSRIFVGTFDYVAPEQLADKPVDARADVYALGCVLYQLLTGEVPYPRKAEPAKIWAHMSEPPPQATAKVPGLPPAFDEVVLRAMAKDPDERYQSAGDLGRAVLQAAEGASAPARAD